MGDSTDITKLGRQLHPVKVPVRSGRLPGDALRTLGGRVSTLPT